MSDCYHAFPFLFALVRWRVKFELLWTLITSIHGYVDMQALFRALKTKHATPKYGLIFHASLVGQAAPKIKGKISRSLAAKTALAIRYDALGDGQDNSMGLENRAKVQHIQNKLPFFLAYILHIALKY